MSVFYCAAQITMTLEIQYIYLYIFPFFLFFLYLYSDPIASGNDDLEENVGLIFFLSLLSSSF